MFLWIIIVLVSSTIASYLVNISAMTVIGKKGNTVIPVSLITKIFTWISFYVVGKITDWSIPLIICDIIGDTIGDKCVAERWPSLIYYFLVPKKGKKPVMKKIPITTA